MSCEDKYDEGGEVSFLGLSRWILSRLEPSPQPNDNGIGIHVNSLGHIESPSVECLVRPTFQDGSSFNHKGSPHVMVRKQSRSKPSKGVPVGALDTAGSTISYCSSIDLIYTAGYKVAICIDAGKSSLTFRDGSLPFHSLIISLDGVLSSLIHNIKEKKIKTCFLVVLIHKPESKYTKNVWMGDIHDTLSCDKLKDSIADQIMKSGLHDGEDDFETRNKYFPTLQSFLEAITFELSFLSRKWFPVGIVMTPGDFKVNISNVLAQISLSNMSLHLVVEGKENATFFHRDINVLKLIARCCGGSFDLINGDAENHGASENERGKKRQEFHICNGCYPTLLNCVFLKPVFRCSAFSDVPDSSKTSILLATYPTGMASLEHLFSMRLLEGFMLTQITSPQNPFSAFNTVIFRLEKQITKVCALIYEIKCRKEQKYPSTSVHTSSRLATSAVSSTSSIYRPSFSTSSSSSFPFGNQPANNVIISISKLCLKSYRSGFVAEIANSESLRIKKMDENLLNFMDKICSSNPIFTERHLMQYFPIVQSVSRCCTSNTWSFNSIVPTQDMGTFSGANCAWTMHITKKWMEQIPGINTFHIISPTVILMFIKHENTSCGIIMVEIRHQRRYCLRVNLSLLSHQTRVDKAAFVTGVFSTLSKVISKHRVRPISLSRNLYHMLPKDPTVCDNTLEEENHVHSHNSHKFVKYLTFKDPALIEIMLSECGDLKKMFGFQLLPPSEAQIPKVYMFVCIKVNEGKLRESIIGCEFYCINGKFSISYSTEALYKVISPVEDSDGSVSSEVEKCVMSLLKQDSDLLDYYSLVAPYILMSKYEKAKTMDVETFQKMKLCAQKVTRSFASFIGHDLNIEVIDRIFDSLCGLYSVYPVDVLEEEILPDVVLGFTVYDYHIMLIEINSVVDDGTHHIMVQVYSMNIPSSTMSLSSDLVAAKESLVLNAYAHDSCAQSAINPEEDIESFFENFSSVHKSSYAKTLFAAIPVLTDSTTITDALATAIDLCETSIFDIDISSLCRTERNADFAYKAPLDSISRSFNSIVKSKLSPVQMSFFAYGLPPDNALLVKFVIMCRNPDDFSISNSFEISSRLESFSETLKNVMDGVDMTSDMYEVFLRVQFYFPCQVAKSQTSNSHPGVDEIMKSVEIFIAVENLKCLQAPKLGKEGFDVLSNCLKIIPFVRTLDM